MARALGWRVRDAARDAGVRALDALEDGAWRARYALIDRRWIGRLVRVAIGLCLGLTAAEAGLRSSPRALPAGASNILYSCYDPTDPEHVIFVDHGWLSTRTMVPHARTTCAFNGYVWEHRGDAYGFRNPETWPRADVVLFGDSMMYGHGVEERETTAHVLRDELAMTVANLAFTGATASGYLEHLRNFGIPLHPKIAIVVIYANDLVDLEERRREVEMFLRRGVGLGATRIDRDRLVALPMRRESAIPASSGPWWWSRLFRLADFQRRRGPDGEPPYGGFSLHAALPAAANGSRPPLFTPDLAPDWASFDPRSRLAWEHAYMRAAIGLMTREARAVDCQLVIVTLPMETLAGPSLLNAQLQPVREYAESLGAVAIDGGAFISRGGREVEGIRLPRDYHFNADGHRRFAQGLAEELRRRLPALTQ
ncbi:MAG: SGNH/GDSL hydrolase family protein [Sandaracinaceae bacterium]